MFYLSKDTIPLVIVVERRPRKARVIRVMPPERDPGEQVNSARDCILRYIRSTDAARKAEGLTVEDVVKSTDASPGAILEAITYLNERFHRIPTGGLKKGIIFPHTASKSKPVGSFSSNETRPRPSQKTVAPPNKFTRKPSSAAKPVVANAKKSKPERHEPSAETRMAETKSLPARTLGWKMPREVKIAIAEQFRKKGGVNAKELLALIDTYKIKSENIAHLLGYIDLIRRNKLLKRLPK